MSSFLTLESVALSSPSGHRLFSNLSLNVGREIVGVAGRNGQPVDALELTGGSLRRAILPNDKAQRKAAVLAAVTLALFWDTGDVG